MIDKTEVVGYSGTAVETALAVTQANELLQVIQIVLSIIAFVVTISYTVYKWYKKVKDEDSDGGSNITKVEIEDLIHELKEEIKEEESNDNSRR